MSQGQGVEAPAMGLTVAAVARRLGVAPATLRTWDRRYGLGPSGHEAGAHRRYTAADLARLEHMRSLVNAGVPLATAAEQALSFQPDPEHLAPVTELRRVTAAAGTVEGRPGGGSVVSIPGGTPHARGLARAAQSLDGPACSAIIRETLDQRGVVWTWDHLLVPVMTGVGERWENSGRGVDVEHILSDAVQGELSGRARKLATPVNSRPVILATLERESHTLPLWALAAALAERGVECRMLGPRTPVDVLEQASRRIGAGVVFVWSQLSATEDIEPLAELTRMRPAPRVILGGPGWRGETPTGIERTYDLTGAVARIASLVGG
ncbi:MAG: MerR family transcriptional regulator [Actinomycetota bacterium]